MRENIHSTAGAVREDNETLICPLCGTAESIAFLPEEQQKAILAAAEAAENARL